jgi:hypothetical protein
MNRTRVPEVAIDEYGYAATRHDDIWRTSVGESAMDPEAGSKSM